MAMADGFDVLEHRTGFGTRRGWRLAGLAVVGALTVAVGGGFVDRRLRSHEFDQILTGCRAAEADSVYAERQVVAMLDYAAPLLQRPDASVEVTAGMATLVRATASASADSLAPGRSRLAAVTVLPWHGPQREARDACRSFLDEVDRRLRRVAVDLSAADLPTGYLKVQQRAARAALLAAAVEPEGAGEAGRIFAGTP